MLWHPPSEASEVEPFGVELICSTLRRMVIHAMHPIFFFFFRLKSTKLHLDCYSTLWLLLARNFLLFSIKSGICLNIKNQRNPHLGGGFNMFQPL